MVLFCGQLSDVTFAAIWISLSEPGGFVAGSTSGYLSQSPCPFPALPRPAEIVRATATAFPPCGVGDGREGGSAWPRCRGTWSAYGQPPAPKPDPNTLVYPGEGELAVGSRVKYGSSLCRSVLCVFRAPHTVQEM